jgi:hypothetical protein
MHTDGACAPASARSAHPQFHGPLRGRSEWHAVIGVHPCASVVPIPFCFARAQHLARSSLPRLMVVGIISSTTTPWRQADPMPSSPSPSPDQASAALRPRQHPPTGKKSVARTPGNVSFTGNEEAGSSRPMTDCLRARLVRRNRTVPLGRSGEQSVPSQGSRLSTRRTCGGRQRATGVRAAPTPVASVSSLCPPC